MGTKKKNHTDPICFRCFESDFRWYFQWTFLKIKNVGKIKKNVKKRALNKKRKKRVLHLWFAECALACVLSSTTTTTTTTTSRRLPTQRQTRRASLTTAEPLGGCCLFFGRSLRVRPGPRPYFRRSSSGTTGAIFFCRPDSTPALETFGIFHDSIVRYPHIYGFTTKIGEIRCI